MALRIALLATIWVAWGCSSSGGAGSLGPSSLPPSEAPAAGSTEGPSTGTGTIDLPGTILDPVVADIARVAGVPSDQVTVLSAASVTFPDGGLGCPEPGMVYIQVQVEGFKVIAQAGGTTYDYRGTGPGSFRRCTSGG